MNIPARRWLQRCLLGLTFLPVLSFGVAAGARVLPEGQKPADRRLGPLKDLNGYFPFSPPATKAAWENRADSVRRRVQVANGLWPQPEKTPLNAVIHGRIERDDYTIDKVYFESRPGFFVTGNLYRPREARGNMPGVLFAHGHWENARLSLVSDAELRGEIATGQERFWEGGRSRFQSMCVQLARMGCVVFQYDMLGNADSQQIPMSVAHTFAKQRPHLNSATGWGFFSARAESLLQSVMGLQTWNSVRALDFLLAQPGVDPERIACTGASGGGTQTFLLGAVDPRVKLSFPAVMVSTGMQGGCTCENTSLLRVGTGNVELAALFAPKPQGMTTANDWTKEMSTKGFPELQQLYGLYGAKDAVMLHRGEHFPHNYNAVSRMAFYNWLSRHFKLQQTEPVIERDYKLSTPAELSVWDAAHPQPPGGEAYEATLLRQWQAQDEQLLAALSTREESFRRTYLPAWKTLLDVELAGAGETAWSQKTKEDRGDFLEMGGLIRNATYREELPVVFLHPKNWNHRTVVWLTGRGKAGIFGADGQPTAAVRSLLSQGTTVVGVDLIHQGEFTSDGGTMAQAPVVAGPREVPAYTYGYNNSVFVWRVQDVVSVVTYIRSHEQKSEWLALVGTDGAAGVVAGARLALGKSVNRTVLDTAGFRFARISDYRSPDFLPGGVKYGDLPGLLAAGEGEVQLAGETESELAQWQQRYPHAGQPRRLAAATGDACAKACIP